MIKDGHTAAAGDYVLARTADDGVWFAPAIIARTPTTLWSGGEAESDWYRVRDHHGDRLFRRAVDLVPISFDEYADAVARLEDAAAATAAAFSSQSSDGEAFHEDVPSPRRRRGIIGGARATGKSGDDSQRKGKRTGATTRQGRSLHQPDESWRGSYSGEKPKTRRQIEAAKEALAERLEKERKEALALTEQERRMVRLGGRQLVAADSVVENRALLLILNVRPFVGDANESGGPLIGDFGQLNVIVVGFRLLLQANADRKRATKQLRASEKSRAQLEQWERADPAVRGVVPDGPGFFVCRPDMGFHPIPTTPSAALCAVCQRYASPSARPG